MKLNFVPYYYGPYSVEIADAISSLKANGIIEESIKEIQAFNFATTFEPRLYIYKLTNIGKEFAISIDSKYKKKSNRIKYILTKMKSLGANDDYKTLSIAAKMYHILGLEEKAMTATEILEEAEFLKWKISKNEAKAAIKFLNEMELVTLAANKH